MFRFHYGNQMARHTLIIMCITIILLPMVYLVMLAFNNQETMGIGTIQFSFKHLQWLFSDTKEQHRVEPNIVSFPFWLYLFNSTKIAFITSILIVFLSVSSGYALSRLKIKSKDKILLGLMLVQMFPSAMALLAFFIIINWIGNYLPFIGYNTHAGLILIYLGGTPFSAWLIKNYMDTIPKSIEEAAIIDGCTPFQIFYKIFVPLSLPIISVTFILAFIGTYSDFILASTFLNDESLLTFSVGLNRFLGNQRGVAWGKFAAACVLGALPISLMFMSVHRYIISGLTAGSTKG